MADVRFRVVNWGREKSQGSEGEGTLFVEQSQGESRRECST